MAFRKIFLGTLFLTCLFDGYLATADAQDRPGLLRRRRAASVPQAAAKAPLSSGIDREYFDKSVRYQDDLYRAVNGLWLEKTEIPADRPDFGAFTLLADKAESDLHDIITECAAAKNNTPGSERQKVEPAKNGAH